MAGTSERPALLCSLLLLPVSVHAERRAMGKGTGTGRGMAWRSGGGYGAANGSRSGRQSLSSSLARRAGVVWPRDQVSTSQRRGPQRRWFGSCRRALVGSAYRDAMRPFGVWRFPLRLRGGAILSLSVHGARRRRPAVRTRIGIRGEVVRKVSAGRAVFRFRSSFSPIED